MSEKQKNSTSMMTGFCCYAGELFTSVTQMIRRGFALTTKLQNMHWNINRTIVNIKIHKTHFSVTFTTSKTIQVFVFDRLCRQQFTIAILTTNDEWATPHNIAIAWHRIYFFLLVGFAAGSHYTLNDIVTFRIDAIDID